MTVLVAALCLLLAAQGDGPPPAPEAAPSGRAAAAPAEPVPEGPAAASPAPPAASPAHIADPAFVARARAYTRGNHLLYLADGALNFAVLAWLVFSGASAAAWGRIRRRAGGGFGGSFLYIAGFLVFMSAVTMPLDYYDGFVREHAYGFSTQTTASWFADRLKGLTVMMVVSVLFLTPLYAAIRRFPRAWWALGAALGCAFAVLLTAVYPVFIAPLFNTFTPLEDQELRRTILDMARGQGIRAEEVFQMDASSRTSHDNAYVAGLLGTERIVLYDVLLGSYTPDEVAFVMGHEMGHYVLGHVWMGVGLAMVLITAGFFLAHRTLRWGADRLAARTGFASPGEIATLPMLLLAVSSFLFATLPIQNAFLRSLEAEADRFGLGAAARPEAAPGAFARMALRNLSDPEPHPLVEWFLHSHPSIGKRIRAAEEYVEARRAAAGGG